MMTKYIPAEITEAEKEGFSAPDSSWFKGESIEFVKRRLISRNSPLYEILDKNSIISIINKHFDGKENKRLFIWSMLNLDEWITSQDSKIMNKNLVRNIKIHNQIANEYDKLHVEIFNQKKQERDYIKNYLYV